MTASSGEFVGTLLNLWEAKHLIHSNRKIKGKRSKTYFNTVYEICIYYVVSEQFVLFYCSFAIFRRCLDVNIVVNSGK